MSQCKNSLGEIDRESSSHYNKTIAQPLSCMLTQPIISQAKQLLYDQEKSIERRYRTHLAMADPTRLKIVFLLKVYKELCPTDIANILSITRSAVSHQMRILEHCGVVKKIRRGKIICYSLLK
jgi:predicted transcriptional regulator